MATHIPAAERAKGVASGTSRAGSRAFHVACNKKLPTRNSNFVSFGLGISFYYERI